MSTRKDKLCWGDFHDALDVTISIGHGISSKARYKEIVYNVFLDRYYLSHGDEVIALSGCTKSEEIQKLLQQYNDL